MRVLAVDCETTGLETFLGAEAFQVAAHLLELDEHGELVIKASYCTPIMQITNYHAVTQKALSINGIEMDQLRQGADRKAELQKFLRFLGKNADRDQALSIIPYKMLGYHSQFDSQFIKQWFYSVGLWPLYPLYFHHHPLDVKSMVWFEECFKRSNIGASTALHSFKHLSPGWVQHDPLSDAKAAVDVVNGIR